MIIVLAPLSGALDLGTWLLGLSVGDSAHCHSVSAGMAELCLRLLF